MTLLVKNSLLKFSREFLVSCVRNSTKSAVSIFNDHYNGCSMSKRSGAFRQPIFIGYAELNYTNLILHDNHCNGFGQIFLENL